MSPSGGGIVRKNKNTLTMAKDLSKRGGAWGGNTRKGAKPKRSEGTNG